MVVGTAPGGINDISARFVARHLGQYIPGNPTIVVQNQPGAGGITSANRLSNTFAHDGSVIAKLERAVPLLAIQGDPNVNFDPLKITWLGSLSSYANDAYLMLVMATNPIKSVAELKGARQVDHAWRRQRGVEQSHLRHHRQGDSRPQHQGGARLYRRGADVPRHAARRDRRPDHRL